MKRDIKNALDSFGVDKLWPEQEQALDPILRGQDVIISLRTGGGKSLLYQLPAFMDSPGEITLVLSPLIALQTDQVLSLRHKLGTCNVAGEAVIRLNSSLTVGQRDDALCRIQAGRAQLVYLSPEQLQNMEVQTALQSATVRRVVVDEAHVLARYATGFRKAYGKIGKWISTLPSVPQILALSATVTAEDIKEIKKTLGMKKPDILRFPIRRENLALAVRKIEMSKKESEQKRHRIMNEAVERALNDWDGAGSALIYCTTVEDVKRLSKWLRSRRWEVASYHGQQEKTKRAKTQALFLSGKVPVVVCTNAFGLGIDKPDVRLVIHAGLPLSLEGYVQELGRAGRDGKKATCVLLYSPSDFAKNKHIIVYSSGKKAANRAIKQLNALKELLHNDKCLWQGIERYFNKKSGEPCGRCQHCRSRKSLA